MWTTKRQNPDEWGAKNIVYGPSTGHPGPYDPDLTPYTRAFARAFGDAGRWRIIAQVLSAQSGKTAIALCVVGERLDNRPVPTVYVGPNQDFFTKQFEPRFVEMLESCESLRSKMPGGIYGKAQTKTMKRIAGVRLRFAHAGSSAALKSDSFGMMLVDEFDEIARSIGTQGGAMGLVEARGDAYADAQVGIISTPSLGMVDIVRDEASGLDFWGVAEKEELGSPIWELWQTGTRHHFCWPCPGCGEYFVPRLKQLRWPDNATASQALRNSWIECPHCGFEVREEHKAECNRRGEYVAPGETIDRDGNRGGSPSDTRTLSLWASGLCSPFKTIGERAERYLRALASGNQSEIQSTVNSQFGELYVHSGGSLMDAAAVAALAEKFEKKVPDGVRFLVAGVDVQGNRLVYVIRGFGAQGTSWLIEFGQIWGPTKGTEVWDKLSEKLREPIDGRLIKLAFVDAGFRPGEKTSLPVHRVYEFARKHKRFVFATKGSSHVMIRPMVNSAIEVDAVDGASKKFGLRLVRLDADHWKSVVHERLSFDRDAPGALHLSDQIDDDYCQQLVSETKVVLETGKYKWIKRHKDNHMLDAEALCAAAAYRIGVDRMKAAQATARDKSLARQAKTRAAGPAAKPLVEREVAVEREEAPTPPAVAAKSLRSRFSGLGARFNR